MCIIIKNNSKGIRCSLPWDWQKQRISWIIVFWMIMILMCREKCYSKFFWLTKLLNILEKGSTLTCTKNNNPLTNNETVILDCSRHCFYLTSGLICFTLGSASSIFEGDFSQNMLIYSQELSKFFKSLHSVLLPIQK